MATYILLENSQVLGSFKFKGDIVTVPDGTIPAFPWDPLDEAAKEAVKRKEQDLAEKQANDLLKESENAQRFLKEKEELAKQLQALKVQRDSLERKLKRAEITALKAEAQSEADSETVEQQ